MCDAHIVFHIQYILLLFREFKTRYKVNKVNINQYFQNGTAGLRSDVVTWCDVTEYLVDIWGSRVHGTREQTHEELHQR